MKKSDLVITSIFNKRSSFRFETLRSVIFNVIRIKEGYKFLNRAEELLLPMSSFYPITRTLCDTKSKKIISDMIINEGFNTNLVGTSEYYGDKVGDIFCEYGCVYSKTGRIYCLTVNEILTYKNTLVVNILFKSNEFIKCVIKNWIESSSYLYDNIVFDDVMNYITVK